jgi:short-subunit dehydrogenase
MRALITGASTGIGYHLACEFAQHGYDLVVVADEERIFSSAEDFRALGVRVDAHCLDLSNLANLHKLSNTIDHLDVLALNAGMAVYGDFVRHNSLDDEIKLLNLNIVGTTVLAKLLIPKMFASEAPRVLITSSIAARMPGPLYATYAASKSFLLSFSEALRNELSDSKVKVTCLMPGGTDTPIFARSGMSGTVVGRGPKDEAADVAKQAFAALMRGDDHVIAASLKSKIEGFGAKYLPERLLAFIHRQETKPAHG